MTSKGKLTVNLGGRISLLAKEVVADQLDVSKITSSPVPLEELRTRLLS